MTRDFDAAHSRHLDVEQEHLRTARRRTLECLQAIRRLAVQNIRERLALFFDAEARMETTVQDGRYRVEIEMPYRAARA